VNSATVILILFFSLVGIGVLFLVESFPTSLTISPLHFSSLNLSEERINLQEELIISGVVTGESIERIQYQAPTGTQEYSCDLQNSCIFTFTDRFSYNQIAALEITAISAAGERLTEKRTIQVIGTSQTCVDGTPFNTCSTSLPGFCATGTIIPNCSACGCPENALCRLSGSCTGKGVNLNIVAITFSPSSYVRLGMPFTPEISFTFTGDVYQGAEYHITLDYLPGTGNPLLSQETTLILAEDYFEGALISLSLPTEKINRNATLDILLTVQGIVGGLEERSIPVPTRFENALIISDDRTPTQTPANLTATYTEGILLQWSGSSSPDTVGYVIYQSQAVNPAFVSYSRQNTVSSDAQAYLITNPRPGQNFFVITAIDGFGNESAYSNVAEFELN